MQPGEFGYIEWIREQQRMAQAATASAWGRVEIGPGDDCAVVRGGPSGPDDRLLITTDMMLEGAHFTRSDGAERIGRKLLAVSVSDVAAMGGLPLWAVTSVGFAPHPSDDLKAGLWRGLHAAASEFGVALVGGDVTAWRTAADSPGLVLSLTLIGHTAGIAPVLRAGAAVGDAIFVTGTLGGSLAGKHLDFSPRVREGRFLAEHGFASAMMDLSDGLSGDLAHIAEESRVGAVLDAAAIPISHAARDAAQHSGRSPVAHALDDGEDFELLLTVPAARADELLAKWPFAPEVPIARIGEIRAADAGVMLRTRDRRESPLVADSWDHLR